MQKRETFQALSLPSNDSCIVTEQADCRKCGDGLVWRGVMMGTVHVLLQQIYLLQLFPTKFHLTGHTLQQKFKKLKKNLNPKLDLQAYSCCYSSGHS
jgi:hypothetical protein